MSIYLLEIFHRACIIAGPHLGKDLSKSDKLKLETMSLINILILALGFILIVIGSILKYSSPAVFGDIVSLAGLFFAVYSVFSNQTEKILRETEKNRKELSAIRKILEEKL